MSSDDKRTSLGRDESDSGDVTRSQCDVASQQHQMEVMVPRRGARWCDNMALFTANAGCMLFLWMVGVVYTGAVVRTLERRFGLGSTQTGVVMACGDIVHMSIVVFVGYFARHAHKPRIMSVMALFSAVGFVLMVLPHWISSHTPASITHCTLIHTHGPVPRGHVPSSSTAPVLELT